jgi:hypothetical protein
LIIDETTSQLKLQLSAKIFPTKERSGDLAMLKDYDSSRFLANVNNNDWNEECLRMMMNRPSCTILKKRCLLTWEREKDGNF